MKARFPNVGTSWTRSHYVDTHTHVTHIHIYSRMYISRDEGSEDNEFLAPWQTREWEFRLVESGSTEICADV